VPYQHLEYFTRVNNITFQMVSAGWLALDQSTLEVDVCGDSCTCYGDGNNGFWAGTWCTACDANHQGPYCTDVIDPRSAPSPGGYIVIAVLTLMLGVSIAFSYVLYKRTNNINAMLLQHKVPLLAENEMRSDVNHGAVAARPGEPPGSTKYAPVEQTTTDAKQ